MAKLKRGDTEISSKAVDWAVLAAVGVGAYAVYTVVIKPASQITQGVGNIGGALGSNVVGIDQFLAQQAQGAAQTIQKVEAGIGNAFTSAESYLSNLVSGLVK